MALETALIEVVGGAADRPGSAGIPVGELS